PHKTGPRRGSHPTNKKTGINHYKHTVEFSNNERTPPDPNLSTQVQPGQPLHPTSRLSPRSTPVPAFRPVPVTATDREDPGRSGDQYTWSQTVCPAGFPATGSVSVPRGATSDYITHPPGHGSNPERRVLGH